MLNIRFCFTKKQEYVRNRRLQLVELFDAEVFIRLRLNTLAACCGELY